MSLSRSLSSVITLIFILYVIINVHSMVVHIYIYIDICVQPNKLHQYKTEEMTGTSGVDGLGLRGQTLRDTCKEEYKVCHIL